MNQNNGQVLINWWTEQKIKLKKSQNPIKYSPRTKPGAQLSGYYPEYDHLPQFLGPDTVIQ